MRVAQKRNILFIQVDQLSARALAAYGNDVCKTPTIDHLVSKGTLFERAYCNSPLCSPSRFSMMTGQLPSDVGAFDNGSEFPAGIPTFAHYLRQMGYKTCLSGKMHFIGPDQLHGFEERLTSDIYPSDFQWSAQWGEAVEPDFVTDARIVTSAGVCTSSVQIEYDNLVTSKAREKLVEYAKQAEDDPFFLTVSYTHPHDPFLCQQAYWDLYEGIDVGLPKIGRIPDNEQDPHSYRIMKNSGLLTDFSEEQLRRARRAYYGAISYIDDQIGDLLNTLEQTGQAENTVIIFTSDHGEMLGERGLWKKSHFYEAAARVPLLICGPGIPEKQRVKTLVSLVDLFPTFLTIANDGLLPELVEPLAGESLLSFIDKEAPDRIIYAEYLAENALAPMLMVRHRNFKYVTSEGYLTLFFDLKQDPDEIENLIGARLEDEPAMAYLARSRWDNVALAEAVVLSQRQRQFINEALAQGRQTAWDFEADDGAERWYRGDVNYNEWAFDFIP